MSLALCGQDISANGSSANRATFRPEARAEGLPLACCFCQAVIGSRAAIHPCTLEAHKTPGAAGHNSRHSGLSAVRAGACLERKRAGLDQELVVRCPSRTRTGILSTTTFQPGSKSYWWTMTRCASGSLARCSSAANMKVNA